MFFGTYEHSLDSKGRLVIPAKFRSQIGNLLYVLKGFDGALSVYKEAEFTKMMEEVSRLAFNKKDSRAYIRAQLSSVCELEVDKQGRVQLPVQLLAKHSIGKDVVIIGVIDHMEIWDKETYHQYEEQSNQDFEEIAEKITSSEDER